MTFDEVLDQVRDLLQQRGRVTYRSLKLRFQLDDEMLAGVSEELIEAERVAQDDNGKVLVWTGGDEAAAPSDAPSPVPSSPIESSHPEAERRQLTVMFCDLVSSTALSEQLDPEELREVVRAYQQTSGKVIERYEGYIAQYLGDGILVYFGYPTAHEDDAARAARAGLGIVAAVQALDVHLPQALQVRIGIHTGLVVVGEMGDSNRQEQLALGETPNIAARVQGKAEPDTVVISAATQRMVAGLFETEDQGLHDLKGISTPQSLYRITAESPAQSRFEVAVRSGLTPLVGREAELSVLRERWTQAQAGNGQVVLLSGEPGIGKSRLVEELKAQMRDEGVRQIEFRCSPYHQNSALHPITEHLQHLLQFASDDTLEAKLGKLQQRLGHYRFPQADTVPLLAVLLSLPHPEDVAPLSLSPQKQKERTQAALLAWLIEESEQTPIYNAWEDLHWADPSTLELLDRLLSQVPTTRLLVLLTFRPEFVPPWGAHSYMSHLTLSRLGQPQVNAMVERVTGGKALPDEVIEQIATKTDGVPLFVEELTKMVIESDLVRVVNGHYELTGPLPPLAIPSTLQDSLMARLDRLATTREVAQLGATLGREFTYELLHAVSPLGEDHLQQGLRQLVEAELVFQHGVPPQARYLFKHALVQDTAYQSLLKSKRQQLHQQVARMLEEQFPETIETQPEILAHHYTEAGLGKQAIPYWQQAGQQAMARSAHSEAIRHLSHALELLATVDDTPARAQQELALQMTLGTAHIVTKGFAAPEAGLTYARADALCRGLGDRPEGVDVLVGLWAFHVSGQSALKTAREVAEQLLRLAQDQQDSTALLKAHIVLSMTLFYEGELLAVPEHVDPCLELYEPELHHKLFVSSAGYDRGIITHCWSAMTRWLLGYPDQALASATTAVALAQELAHPYTSAVALVYAAWVERWCGELQAAREHAEAAVTLSHEHGFTLTWAWGTVFRSLALAGLGHSENQVQEAYDAVAKLRGAGIGLWMPHLLARLAETQSKVGQVDEALRVLDEALEISTRRGDRCYEAELYRLKGQMTLQSSGARPAAAVQRKVEAGFEKALEIAKAQSAKSLELRGATSLARLWQQQGKTAEAHDLLAPVYNWFTEGFATADLKDAKALLDELMETQ